jgi:hypothetical protein
MNGSENERGFIGVLVILGEGDLIEKPMFKLQLEFE